jgi:hypothetical protein
MTSTNAPSCPAGVQAVSSVRFRAIQVRLICIRTRLWTPHPFFIKASQGRGII